MNQEDLTRYNIGRNLDDLANLDPRGYGVCRILYDAALKHAGEPLSMHAAKRLFDTVKPNDVVYILTGFVLLPHKKAEMDGIVGSMLLARALEKASGAKPVIVCPEDCVQAVRNLTGLIGLHLYETIGELKTYPISMAVLPFTKDRMEADAQAESLIAEGNPVAVIAVEAPGANLKGVYHNALGMDVSGLEAKSDVLFAKLAERGVLNIAVGDLGNEIGMGTLGEHLVRYIPRVKAGTCACGCGGGIAAATSADVVVTATVSDWGCYGMIAALAYLCGDPEILQSAELEEAVIRTASRSGMIDMSGRLLPAVDGCDVKMNVLIVDLMRECVVSALKLRKSCAHWFDKVLELGYYADRSKS